MGGLVIGHGFEDVLVAAQADAPWALQRLYEDLAPTVMGYLRLRGAPEPDDTASEAFLSVFGSLSRFVGDETAFRSWVFTIVHRRLVDERRRQGRRAVSVPLDERDVPTGGDVEDEALAGFRSPWVGQALAVLSDEQREVLLLRIVAELSVDEVAEVVGKRPGAVRGLQHRALKMLRRELADRRVSSTSRGEG